MTHFDLLIIGGDAAGMSAASQARRTDETMSIAVLEKGLHVSYAACGMPYLIGGKIDDPTRLIAIDQEAYVQKRKIEILKQTEAVSVDFTAKRVTIRSGDKEALIEYEKLLIATGARPFVPPIEGIGSDGVFFLRALSDGIAIREYISGNNPSSGVIIGGGFIGLEMAEALRNLGMKTTILERLGSVAMSMSPEIRGLVEDSLRAGGVDVRTGVTVQSIRPRGNRRIVETDSGSFDADFILVSVGIIPNTDFLHGTELAMTERGAVIVDEQSRTSIPGVFAAGDCATARSLITGKNVYIPLGTTANKQGRVAGLQAAGIKDETFPGVVGSQMVKVFDLEVGKTGLNAEDAVREGITSASTTIAWKSRAGYCPEAANILVNLTVDAGTEKVIGGEVAGTDGAALRMDIIAAAVTAGMKIDQVAYLDLGYAPPFSPVWDPINAAAQKLMRKIARKA